MPKKKSKPTSKKTVKRPTKKASRATKKSKQEEPIEIKLPVNLSKFLEEAKAKYDTLSHKTVYTTYDTAMTLKREAADVAKTLLVKADKDFVIVVVPGDKNLDFNKLKKVISAELKKAGLKTVKKISLASEKIIEKAYTKSPGALPPFGMLYKLQTYVDKSLGKPRKLILNGGSFEVSLEMTPKEFMRITAARVGSFSKKR